MKNNLYEREIATLATGLITKGIPFKLRNLFDGYQIIVEGEWDAICHEFSYGHEDGLLEIAGTLVRNPDDDVEGFLTAEDILERL